MPIHPSAPAKHRAPEAGSLVLSLDFEMRWGMHHVLRDGDDRYHRNLRNSPAVVDRLLSEFSARGLRATWATVGAVACDGWDEYWRRAPGAPRYRTPRLAVTRDFMRVDPTGELHFSPTSIRRILGTSGQDLGCHTFSHTLCARPGATSMDFADDLAACRLLLQERYAASPRSFVYPCNEVCHCHALAAGGFRVARTNSERRPAMARRGFRWTRWLAECRPPRPHASPREHDGLLWTEGSAFVRFNLTGLAWKWHLSRLRRSLRDLGPGRFLHVWWHPHNLGHDLDGCLRRFRPFLDDAAEAMTQGRLQSLHMGDLEDLQCPRA